MNGEAAPLVPAADDAAATNKLGSMMSVTERRIVEFSQTLPELRTSSSLRQSFDNMVAFLDTSALDLRHAMKHKVHKKFRGGGGGSARTLRENRESECRQQSIASKCDAQDQSVWEHVSQFLAIAHGNNDVKRGLTLDPTRERP